MTNKGLRNAHMFKSGSRPSDKGGGGGGTGPPEGMDLGSKKVFRPFGPQFGLNVRGGGVGRPPWAPSLDLPLHFSFRYHHTIAVCPRVRLRPI